jgi:hypothetical protein
MHLLRRLALCKPRERSVIIFPFVAVAHVYILLLLFYLDGEQKYSVLCP